MFLLHKYHPIRKLNVLITNIAMSFYSLANSCFLVFFDSSPICLAPSIKCIALNLILCSIEIYWFAWTKCSGGRDLSGNKRTNKDQSFDQEFKSGNESLRLSCKNGYPIRVIR